MNNAYNGFDQLVFTYSGSSGTVYAYNAQGIRTAKVTADSVTSFLLDGGNVVGEVQNGVLSASYLRGVNLIRRIGAEGMEYYLFNAHGDVVGLTDGFGSLTKSYDYDAFGNEKNPSETDTNPFRYCGEYFDTETGTYYLRARYYDPEIGRFTQQDPHWSPANAIYGDNPRKINERQDALGLTTYAYAPQITAIMQSGNLYVYCVNSPVQYYDPTGSALINIICAAVGALAGVGFGDYIATSLNLEGWKYWAVRAGVVVGGAVIGWFAGAAITSVISRYLALNPGTTLSLASKLGPVFFTNAMKFLGIDPFALITDSGKFHGLLQNVFNTPTIQIGYEWAETLIRKAQQFGISIRLDKPHDNAWNIWHLNVGKYHVGLLPNTVDAVKKLLGVE